MKKQENRWLWETLVATCRLPSTATAWWQPGSLQRHKLQSPALTWFSRVCSQVSVIGGQNCPKGSCGRFTSPAQTLHIRGCSSVCMSSAGNAPWKGFGPADAQELLRKMAPYCPSWSVLITSVPRVCPSLPAQEMRRNLDPEITNQKGKNAPVMQREDFPWPP